MGYLKLVRANLWRRKARTILTALSTVVAFLLFGLLNGVDAYFQQVLDHAHLDVLVTSSTGGLPLPFAYLQRLQAVPGVTTITYILQIGGTYIRPTQHLAVLMTEPKSFFRLDQDMKVSQADLQALAQTRIGALATPVLAQKYGWKRGDLITMKSGTPQKNGSSNWQFRIIGFYDLTLAPDAPVLIANYSYADNAQAANRGTVLQYWSLIANPRDAAPISRAIDNLFVNSPVQTRTMSQKDATQSLFTRLGNISFFLDAIIAAVFFTLLLLVGNALMQSYRERIRELALLKTLGFSDTLIAGLVMTEALLLCLASAVLGLGLAWIALPLFGKATGAALPHPPPIVFATGLGLAALTALVCGAIPAWKAGRLTIATALARH
jgi:putative ABC transport system permease protein